MIQEVGKNLFTLTELRNRVCVFRDRAHAGKTVAGMLKAYANSEAVVMAVPAGGIQVGAVIARELRLLFDVAVVSKMTPSWDTEVGYGAVAFDGTVMLNETFVSGFGLTQAEIQEGIRNTKEKVARRMRILRGKRPLPDLRGTVILVDDGIASGFTLRAAVQALRRARSKEIVIAVPTAHRESIGPVAEGVEAVYCANLRTGFSFAVVDAYQHWRDVREEEVLELLEDLREEQESRILKPGPRGLQEKT